MSAKSKRQNLKAAKERRQKQILVVGGALLLVLVAIQVPRLLKGGGSAAPATTAASTTSSSSTSTDAAAPAAGTSGSPALASATPSGHTRLPDSDVAPKRTVSQLVSFELFDSKDPFVQQVSDEQAPAAAPAAPATTAPAPPAGSAPAPAPAAPAPATTAPATTTPATGGTFARRMSAEIEVNGARESVAVDQSFPKASPTFKLVSLSDGLALIGIANGAYASGAQTVSLQSGKTLTLVNTSDGKRYELRLLTTS